MTCLVCSWNILQSLDVVGVTPAQQVLQVGGPYPETRAGWLRLVREIDPLAADWMDYAFEAHRITPRTHAMVDGGMASCLHPDARLLTREITADVVTCRVCRWVHDLEEAIPQPSIWEMGDVQEILGPVVVLG